MVDRTPPGQGLTAAKALGFASLSYIILAFVYFLPAFLPGQHIFGTDYLAGGYFVYEFISNRIADGTLPKWLPHLYGGVPVFANPGSTYYPIRVVIDLLVSAPRILPLLFAVHAALAGIGMYLLLRELQTRRWVAWVGGLAFEFTGILMSTVYAGHDGRFIVASLAPMFFFFLHRGVRTGGLAPFAGAASTLGLTLLSFQIQSNYYLLVAGAIWAVFALFLIRSEVDARGLGKRVVMGLVAVAFGFTLASVNFLPFLDYVPESPRGAEGGRGWEYSTSWSMPIDELASLAVPEYNGILEHYEGENPFKLHTEYLGAPVLVLLVLGFALARRSRYWWFFLGLSVFSLSIALGGNTPLYRLYYEFLPGTARFRAPSIAYFLVAFSLVVVAMLTLERLAALRSGDDSEVRSRGASEDADNWRRAVGWMLGVVAGIAVLLAVASSLVGAGSPRSEAVAAGFVRYAIFTGLTCGMLWLWVSERFTSGLFAIIIAAIIVVDLWIVDRNFLDTVPPPESMFAADDVAHFLQSQPGLFRVWDVPAGPGSRYSGNYLMRFGIDLAAGEHGNHLQRYGEYVGAGQQTYIDWHNFLQYPQFLAAANVRYLLSSVPFDVPFLREVHRGSAIVYENIAALPRTYLVGDAIIAEPPLGAIEVMQGQAWQPSMQAVLYEDPQIDLPGTQVVGEARIIEMTADRVTIQAVTETPALLVLADNDYEGWVATVNGEDSPVLRANHAFRAVALEAGTHEIVFEFRPSDLFLGFAIYLIGWLLLAGYGIFLLIRWWRARGSSRLRYD